MKLRGQKITLLYMTGVSVLSLMSSVARAEERATAEASATATDEASAAYAPAGADDYSASSVPTVDGQLGDIVVTAERREVNLQKAPIAVSAVTADALEDANVTEITGLNGLVPGLLVARSGGGERMISIRGVGSETPENTNTQPGVSYHVDGVYIFNSIAANAAFIDVGQVEVLRGPQGTTFGQGSTGGTINVVTKQPVLDMWSGSADLSAGNYHYIKADAALNVPLGSTIALRGAVQHISHDGYAVATAVPGRDDYELDDQDEVGWKAAAIWQPFSDFSITLNTVQYHSDTHGPAQKNVLDPDPDPRRLSQDYPGQSIIDTELYYGVAKLQTPFATIKSITSYQKLFSHQAWDADGLTADLFFDETYSPLTFTGYNYDHVPEWRTNTESWTQEINFSGDAGPLSWIAGGVYLWSRNKQYIVEYRASDDEILRAPLPEDTPFDDPRVAALTFAQLSSITREAWAGYFEGTLSVTDTLKVIAGIRYNHDKFTGMSASNSNLPTSGPYLQPVPTPGMTSHEWTGKAGLQYQLTPENMLYATYTRGFKPGGLNESAANAAPALLGFTMGTQPTYQPETVDSFEVGSKNRFLGDTAQLNLSAFLYNYKNMQFLEEDAVLYGEGISNAPKAQIYGLELEASWLIDDHWSISGSASWLHGEFTDDYYALDPVAATAAQDAAGYPGYLFWANFYAAALARDAARANINGNDVPKIPKLQGTASLAYTNQIGPGQFDAKVQYIYRGKYQYRLFNDRTFDTTPSYNQVNLDFEYQPDAMDFSFGLSVINLFDENGINSRFSDPYGSAQTYDTYIPPRQFLASVSYEF